MEYQHRSRVFYATPLNRIAGSSSGGAVSHIIRMSVIFSPKPNTGFQNIISVVASFPFSVIIKQNYRGMKEKLHNSNHLRHHSPWLANIVLTYSYGFNSDRDWAGGY